MVGRRSARCRSWSPLLRTPGSGPSGCRWRRIESRRARDRDSPTARACCSSTAIRWPTAPSSRSRWRTSPPPPASTPTPSTASPRCWSTCSATSSRPTSRSPSTSRARRSASRSTPSTRRSATRRPRSSAAQLPLIEQVLTAFGITFLKKEGYEADDIIATLTTQAVAGGMEVLILTGDRDSLQLVSDDATVLYPMRGVSDLARMTPEAVEAKYGVPPEPLPRARGHRRRDLRQPAGRAGRRPGVRREVDQPVRRARQRHRPRRPDHRQEGRGAARAPRRRDPQPPPQRARVRPRPRARSRATSCSSRGTVTPR